MNPIFTLLLMLVFAAPSDSGGVGSLKAARVQSTSDVEMLRRAETDIERLSREDDPKKKVESGLSAERQLEAILRLYPNTTLRERVESALRQVKEVLALHDLEIARFYFVRSNGHFLKGAQSRLLAILKRYPEFSQMDEVLFLLGKAALIDERPEDAARYFSRLVCAYPRSAHVSEAYETVSRMGVDAYHDCGSPSTE